MIFGCAIHCSGVVYMCPQGMGRFDTVGRLVARHRSLSRRQSPFSSCALVLYHRGRSNGQPPSGLKMWCLRSSCMLPEKASSLQHNASCVCTMCPPLRPCRDSTPARNHPCVWNKGTSAWWKHRLLVRRVWPPSHLLCHLHRVSRPTVPAQDCAPSYPIPQPFTGPCLDIFHVHVHVPPCV